jgi:pimeloyl-CoA synthetase
MQLNSLRDGNTIKALFGLGANVHRKVGVATIAVFWSDPDFARAMGKEDLSKRIEEAIAWNESHSIAGSSVAGSINVGQSIAR